MNEVKKIRQQSGLSQKCFAEKFGIPVRTLQQWEQDAQKPPAYVVDMIRRLTAYRKALQDFPTLENREIVKKTWKECIDRPFMNCSRIYPIQQKKIRKLLDILTVDRRVEEVVIFGSSVTSQCHIGSDIDLFIQMEEDINPMNAADSAVDFAYDLFTNYMIDSRLMNEIRKKGVVVYRREGLEDERFTV